MTRETSVPLVALTGIHFGYEPNEDDEEEVAVLTYDARLHTHVTQIVRPTGGLGRAFLIFEATDKALQVRLRGVTSVLAKGTPEVTMVGGKANGKRWTFSRVEIDELNSEFVLEGLEAASFLHHASLTEHIRVEEPGEDGRQTVFDAIRMTTTPVQSNLEFYAAAERREAQTTVIHKMSVPPRRFINSAKWSFTMFLLRFMMPFVNGITKILTPLAGRLGGWAGATLMLLILLGVALVLGDQIIDSFNAVVGFVRKPTWAILKPIGVGSIVVGFWLVWQLIHSDLWRDARANSHARRAGRRGDE